MRDRNCGILKHWKILIMTLFQYPIIPKTINNKKIFNSSRFYRKALISICILFLPFQLLSQNEKGFTAGVLGGIVPSQVDGDSYGGYGKIGFQAGFFSVLQTNEQMYWQAEIKWMQKGSKYVSAKQGLYYALNLNYVEVPVSFTYIYRKKILGELGISYGYLFKAMEDNDGNGGVEPVPPMKNNDVEALIGVGYRFSDNFWIMNRLGYSLISIRDYPGGQKYWFNRGWANNLISIAAYYKF